MWLLNLFPDFVFYALIVVGILGIVTSFFFEFLPFVRQYKLPIQIISTIILVVGIWFAGAISNNNSWLMKVKDLESRLAKAEAQSAQVNTILVEKLVEKDKIIKETKNELDKAISKYVTDECLLSNAAVILHNSSSQNELPPSTINTITGTSKVTTAELLSTVNQNYSTYYEIANRLKAWQDWYNEQKKIFESVK